MIKLATVTNTKTGTCGWDTEALQDKKTLLKNAASNIRALNSTYQELQMRIEENWTGAAATAFLSEMSIDVAAVSALADNIETMAEMLTWACAEYSKCSTMVSANMQGAEERLGTIKQ